MSKTHKKPWRKTSILSIAVNQLEERLIRHEKNHKVDFEELAKRIEDLRNEVNNYTRRLGLLADAMDYVTQTYSDFYDEFKQKLKDW